MSEMIEKSKLEIQWVFSVRKILVVAATRFYLDDGWAIASHIALSSLVAFFPFLIILTILATALGTEAAAGQIIDLIFDTLPEHIAQPLTNEVRTVISGGRDLLTVSVVTLLWLSSSGVEALRVGLNRAYNVTDPRSWLFCRLQSVLFVILGVASSLVLGVFILFWPVVWQTIQKVWPNMADGSLTFDILRYTTAGMTLTIALLSAHYWIPAGGSSKRTIWPGILATLILWLITASVFGYYLAVFFENYAATYAGLAGIMATLLFLYIASAIFILGGNLNAAITDGRQAEMHSGS